MLLLFDFSRNAQKSTNNALLSTGKFVQMSHHGDEILCFAQRQQATYHAQIVALYCRNHGIACQFDKADAPCVPIAELQVLGGGHFSWNIPGLTLRLYGRSIAYGPFVRAGLHERLAALPQLAGYTILVEPH